MISKTFPLALMGSILTSTAFAANPHFIPRQVVVKGEPWEFEEYNVVKYLPHAGLTVIQVERGQEMGQINRLREKHVKAHLNYVVKAVATPNDPYYSSYQWNFPAIQAESGWESSTGLDSQGNPVVVAVLDTGLNPNGIDKVNVCPDSGYDAVSKDNDPFDGHFHGTHVSGTIAQKTSNGIGAAGLAYGACIMPVKVLDDTGSGNSADLADGIAYAHQNGARVINMSLGFGSASLQQFVNTDTYDALNAVPSNVVIVAASGNEGATNSVSYPASHPAVISVGAIDSALNIASFSNQGSNLDLVAPGVSILQEAYYGSWGYWLSSGTSMASPHVAAAAALLIAKDETLNRSEVKTLLTSTALDLGQAGFDNTYGEGLIQVADALDAIDVLPVTPEIILNIPELTVIDNQNGTASLSWTDNSENEDGFEIQSRKYGRKGAGNWSTVTSVTGTDYQDNAGTGDFDYRVRAYAGNSSSDWSNIVNVSITSASSSTGGGRKNR